ncbi:MAG: tetratricopeptide repeat protein [Blastocatellia bacterium]|nr:tetratricopeptide repeat protein [Blastocatellia bacterium]
MKDENRSEDVSSSFIPHPSSFKTPQHPEPQNEYILLSASRPPAPLHRRHRRAALIILAATLIAVTAIIYFTSGSRTIDSVAVLPFANTNSDPDAEYLSDGLADSLITRLSQISNLKVMSFNSVSRYRGQLTNSQSVGRDLNVKAVLMGRITQLGDELLISAELIDARDNSRIWGHRYNRKLTDLLAVQEEIANEISERLLVRITGEDRERLAKRETADTEAYRLYLKGRYYWNMRNEEGLKQGINYFNQAIAKDPSYALAYAGLADCYGLLSNYSSTPPQESMPRARAAALRALEIDERLAEAHASLGLVKKEFEWDFAGAQKEFERAIELNRNYPTAYQWQAENLVLLGRLDEALEAMKRAAELDPFSLIIGGEVGWVLYHAHRYDEAIAQLRKMVETDPDFHRNHFFLGRVYEQKHKYAEAIEETQKAISLSGGYALFKASLGHIYGMAGRREEARKILEELQERAKREYISPFALALIHTGMGDKDRAFASMEKAYEARDTILVNYLKDPQLDTLRSDARLKDLIARVGLQP